MQNLYKTRYTDSLGILREVYTIAENRFRGRDLATQRISELHKQEEIWYDKAVAAGMTARRNQEPVVHNTIQVITTHHVVGITKEEVGA